MTIPSAPALPSGEYQRIRRRDIQPVCVVDETQDGERLTVDELAENVERLLGDPARTMR